MTQGKTRKTPRKDFAACRRKIRAVFHENDWPDCRLFLLQTKNDSIKDLAKLERKTRSPRTQRKISRLRKAAKRFVLALLRRSDDVQNHEDFWAWRGRVDYLFALSKSPATLNNDYHDEAIQESCQAVRRKIHGFEARKIFTAMMTDNPEQLEDVLKEVDTEYDWNFYQHIRRSGGSYAVLDPEGKKSDTEMRCAFEQRHAQRHLYLAAHKFATFFEQAYIDPADKLSKEDYRMGIFYIGRHLEKAGIAFPLKHAHRLESIACFFVEMGRLSYGKLIKDALTRIDENKLPFGMMVENIRLVKAAMEHSGKDWQDFLPGKTSEEAYKNFRVMVQKVFTQHGQETLRRSLAQRIPKKDLGFYIISTANSLLDLYMPYFELMDRDRFINFMADDDAFDMERSHLAEGILLLIEAKKAAPRRRQTTRPAGAVILHGLPAPNDWLLKIA